MNLAPFVKHISSSGGAPTGKALNIVRNADCTCTRVHSLEHSVNTINKVLLLNIIVSLDRYSCFVISSLAFADIIR